MKRWPFKRQGKRHSTTTPSGRARRARRLSMERCEDRLVLSGTALTADLVSAPDVQEGGFLAVASNRFLLNRANDFITGDADSINFFGLSSDISLNLNSFVSSDHNGVFDNNSGSIGNSIGFVNSRYTIGDADVDQVSIYNNVDGTISDNVGADNVGAEPSVLVTTPTEPVTVQVNDRPKIGSRIVTNNTTGSPSFDVQPLSTAGNLFATLIPTPGFGPSLNDLDLPNMQVSKPLVPLTDNLVSLDDEITIVNDRLQSRSDNAQGLQGKTSQMLVIDEPMQIVVGELNTNSPARREGGALEVAVAVTTTQRAYETQLSAVVANNLDREGILPTTAPAQTQPFVAELARAVAFETAEGQEKVRTDESNHRADGQSVELPQATLTTTERASSQTKVTRARHALAPVTEVITSEATSRGDTEDVSASLDDRQNGEFKATHEMVLAQWPVLATVIANYLLIEPRGTPATEAVQAPPRRGRQTPIS